METKVTEPQQLFTYEEAGNFLRCSESTIYRLLKCGDLKRRYIRSRMPRIPRYSLEKVAKVMRG